MKKVFFMIMAGMLILASCMNNWDTEEVSNDLYSNPNIGEPNTTIKAIRSSYSNAISNSSYEMVNTDKIIEGIVVANDISGNIYQFVYIQAMTDGATMDTDQGGIAVGIKGLGCLYTLFPVGQKVRINLNGLYVGGYGASPRIGMPYINTNGTMRLGPMSLEQMKEHIMKVGTPNAELVKPRATTAAELTSSNITTLTPMLVRLDNCSISDVGWPYAHWEVGGDTYSEYHDITIDGTKVKQLLYTSTSATFAGDTIQTGKKTIFGLLNRYSSSYQLSLRSLDDIIELEK